MSYVYLDDGFFENPKVVAVGGDAQLLYVTALTYVNRKLTGGVIPVAMVSRLTDRKAPGRLARRLVEGRLWHEPGHDCPACPPVAVDHYVVHDYGEMNRTAVARREKARKAARSRYSGHAPGMLRAEPEHPPGSNGAGFEQGTEQESSSLPRERARADARAPGPYSPTTPVVTSSSSSPLSGTIAEEEDFASLVAERRLARRQGPPPTSPGAWKRRVAEDVRSEFAVVASTWSGTQAELADFVDPDGTQRPVVVERPDCELCGGTTWLETEFGAERCDHAEAAASAPSAAITPKRPLRPTSRSTRMQTIDQALRHAAAIRSAAAYLTDERLRELHRRAEHAVRDGYPANVRGGGSRGPDVPDPVPAYVTGSDPPDVVLRWLTEGMAGLHEAAGVLSAVVGRFENALRVATKDSRASGGNCQACGAWCSGAENDRIRSGYCEADYRAWLRAGRPDRPMFEQQRRAAS